MITVKGFKTTKALEAFEFEPEGLTTLIGGNGAGKSNFISFFRMLSWALSGPGNLPYILVSKVAQAHFWTMDKRPRKKLKRNSPYPTRRVGINMHSGCATPPATLWFLQKKIPLYS